jgi:hypothetical protein
MTTVYANMESFETALNGTATVTFARKSAHITLTNDSTTDNLQFKLNASEDFATLQPSESFDMDISTRQLYLSTGASVAYRMWVFG